ncbi:MAG TPA: carboxymuconolactone decarboxylase family protein [Candidatus Baltobacteraceae bacterium]|nr:carboxymuconolactone decarboxylase family protein [Candidatus Baltobacteraceae bacterium]
MTTDSFDYYSVAPEALRPLQQAGKLAHGSGLEPKLLTLVQLRASQINGCAFCLVLHSMEAEAASEDGKRISGVAGWRDAHWYSDRERAALEWTEALTLIADHRPSDELLAKMRAHFNDRELVFLTLAITVINSFNRFNVAFRSPAEAAEPLFKQLYSLAGSAT